MIAALFLAAASPEAVDLGKQLASRGMLATIAPFKTAAETEEIVAAHPELGESEKRAFRTSAKVTADRLRQRIVDTEGAAYAAALSIPDLRALVAFQATDAAKRQRAAMPAIMKDTMTSLGNIDFKGDAARDFCKASGKLCAVK